MLRPFQPNQTEMTTCLSDSENSRPSTHSRRALSESSTDREMVTATENNRWTLGVEEDCVSQMELLLLPKARMSTKRNGTGI